MFTSKENKSSLCSFAGFDFDSWSTFIPACNWAPWFKKLRCAIQQACNGFFSNYFEPGAVRDFRVREKAVQAGR